MKSERTLKAEIRRVERMKDMAWRAGDTQTEDWMYGAEAALRWAIGEDVMSPYRAFYPAGSEAAQRVAKADRANG